jgi:hypothetical protein
VIQLAQDAVPQVSGWPQALVTVVSLLVPVLLGLVGWLHLRAQRASKERDVTLEGVEIGSRRFGTKASVKAAIQEVAEREGIQAQLHKSVKKIEKKVNGGTT